VSALPPDYDSDPGRWGSWESPQDVHEMVAPELGGPVLDAGCIVVIFMIAAFAHCATAGHEARGGAQDLTLDGSENGSLYWRVFRFPRAMTARAAGGM